MISSISSSIDDENQSNSNNFIENSNKTIINESGKFETNKINDEQTFLLEEETK